MSRRPLKCASYQIEFWGLSALLGLPSRVHIRKVVSVAVGWRAEDLTVQNSRLEIALDTLQNFLRSARLTIREAFSERIG